MEGTKRRKILPPSLLFFWPRDRLLNSKAIAVLATCYFHPPFEDFSVPSPTSSPHSSSQDPKYSIEEGDVSKARRKCLFPLDLELRRLYSQHEACQLPCQLLLLQGFPMKFADFLHRATEARLNRLQVIDESPPRPSLGQNTRLSSSKQCRGPLPHP